MHLVSLMSVGFKMFAPEQDIGFDLSAKLVMFVDGRGNAEYCLNLARPVASIRTTPLKEIMQLDRFRQLRLDA